MKRPPYVIRDLKPHYLDGDKVEEEHKTLTEMFKGVEVYKMGNTPETRAAMRELDRRCEIRLRKKYEKEERRKPLDLDLPLRNHSCATSSPGTYPA